MRRRQGSEKVRPLCFDGLEEELAATVVDIHDRIVENQGFNPGYFGDQREETIERVLSVVSAVFCTYFDVPPDQKYTDIYEQISVFAAHLSKDHIFADANKRTTVIFSIAFLRLSGITLDIEDLDKPDENILYRWIQDVVTGEKGVVELAQTLRAYARKIQ